MDVNTILELFFGPGRIVFTVLFFLIGCFLLILFFLDLKLLRGFGGARSEPDPVLLEKMIRATCLGMKRLLVADFTLPKPDADTWRKMLQTTRATAVYHLLCSLCAFCLIPCFLAAPLHILNLLFAGYVVAAALVRLLGDFVWECFWSLRDLHRLLGLQKKLAD